MICRSISICSRGGVHGGRGGCRVEGGARKRRAEMGEEPSDVEAKAGSVAVRVRAIVSCEDLRSVGCHRPLFYILLEYILQYTLVCTLHNCGLCMSFEQKYHKIAGPKISNALTVPSRSRVRISSPSFRFRAKDPLPLPSASTSSGVGTKPNWAKNPAASRSW